MKYYYRWRELQCLNYYPCHDFSDRNVGIGSATCIEDCPHLIVYSLEEEYVVCSKLNKLDSKRKLERIIK